MRLLTWNIMHGGGGDRLPRIGLALLESDADFIAINEFRGSRGGSLRAILADHGWPYQDQASGRAGENTVFVASRTPIAAVDRHPSLGALSRRLVTVTLENGTAITAAHVPDAQRSDRAGMVSRTSVWRAILDTARTHRDGRHIVMGDLNTGRHRIDEAGTTFSCTAMLGQLAALGFVDAWRAVHGPGARARSWSSHAGSGFRLDHVLVSGALSGAVAGAGYDENALIDGLSDHAPLVVDLHGAG